MNYFNEMAGDIRHIGVLAVPLILTQLAQVALTTTDIAMMGMLGPKEIAAGGLAITIFNQLRTMGTGLVTATGNLVAYANGKNDSVQIRSLVGASFLLSTFAGLLFVGVMLLIRHPLLWLGQDEDVVQLTQCYLSIAALGMLPCLWFQVIRQYTVGLRQPGPLLLITLLSVGLNGGLNYGLMFGYFGLPKLGFVGIAYATSVVYLLAFLMFFGIVLTRKALSRPLVSSICHVDRKALRNTWKMGLPIALTYGSEAAFFTVLTLLIGTLGTHALAAQTITNQVVYIVFMISVGLSHASSITISHACARKEFSKARRLGYTGLGLGIVAMMVIAILYVSVPDGVISLFLDRDRGGNMRVFQLAVGLLMIAAVLQVVDCAQNIGIGLLRGLGDVTTSFKMTLMGYWLVGLPCAYLVGVTLGYGILGVWVGLLCGLSVTACLLLYMFESRWVSLVASAR